MKGLRKILRVSWTATKTNEWVLNKAGVKRELLYTVKARKLAYIGEEKKKKKKKPQHKNIISASAIGGHKKRYALCWCADS